jgi:uncharacterized protein YdhG (YjbR/CyaY superfamily)
MEKSTSQSIDAYIRRHPKKVQTILRKILVTVKQAAPDAEETISYRIPTFKMGGNLVHFAAFSGHVSFFPTSSGVEKFNKELAKYKTSKGTIRFPVDGPIPYRLISKITKFRVREVTREIKDRKRNLKGKDFVNKPKTGPKSKPRRGKTAGSA